MKDKLIWGILVILIFEFIMYRNVTSADTLSFNNEGLASLEENIFTNDNNSNYEVLTYTNPNNYSISISTANIEINCSGTGHTRESDEELVEKNFKINATFSKDENGNRLERITIPKKGTIYIHINSNYNTNIYPENEVSCSYSINLETV